MYKRIIKYTDYNDQKRTQEFYFYLSTKDIKMLNGKFDGGLENFLINMVNNMDGRALLETIELFVLSSYGERSGDGTTFDKSPEVVKKFKYSAAYEQLFDELTETPEAFSDFLKKVLPSDVQNRIVEAEKSGSNANMPEIVSEVMKDAETSNITSVAPVVEG